MIADSDSKRPNEAQIEVAMDEIVFIAKTIDGLYFSMTETSSEHVHLAIRNLVSRIGLIADRCNNLHNYDVDSWVLPPMFEYYANKSNNLGVDQY